MLKKALAIGAGTIWCLCLVQIQTISAQPLLAEDTLQLNVQQAEKMFLDNNLQLLAAHYNIQSAEALVEQSRKWDNPILITDQNVYVNKQFFRHGTDAAGNQQGQVFVQLQQIIKTAGKRGKQVDMAMTNVDLAEWQFKGVMRDLRAVLLKDYYTIAQLYGNARLYDEGLQRLNNLLKAQEAALQAGNIARKEYLRVQALIVSLKQDMADNAKAMNDAEAELKTLLQLTGDKFIKPDVTDEESASLPATGIAGLTDSARIHNTDYRQQVYQLQYNKQNLRLQKALSVPDLTVGPEFDQNSNYAPNYYGLTLSLPIPLWDRNRGNIKAAKLQSDQQEALLKMMDDKLQNDVANAYRKLAYEVQLNSESNDRFYKDYYQLQKNITESYNNRQINMIEFLDYFKDYQDIREKQLQRTLSLRLAKEELNDVVGIDVVK